MVLSRQELSKATATIQNLEKNLTAEREQVGHQHCRDVGESCCYLGSWTTCGPHIEFQRKIVSFQGFSRENLAKNEGQNVRKCCLLCVYIFSMVPKTSIFKELAGKFLDKMRSGFVGDNLNDCDQHENHQQTLKPFQVKR